MTLGPAVHHLHKQKRVHLKHEKYPPLDKLRKSIDMLVWFAGLFGIIMTFPQVWNIWVLRETAGVSAISWAGYFLTAIVWTLYGVVHKEKPIIVMSGIWVFLDIVIVIGVLMY